MTSMLYLLGCGTLAALAVLELKTRNRTPRIQLYLTLLCAMVFCGVFALLVSAAHLAEGQFQPLAALGVLALTAATLWVLVRTSSRFRAIQTTRGVHPEAT